LEGRVAGPGDLVRVGEETDADCPKNTVQQMHRGRTNRIVTMHPIEKEHA
jgi:hypothetical protein